MSTVFTKPHQAADVIRRRFGIGYPHEQTLEEIGQHYGFTRQRVEQMESKALAELIEMAHAERGKYENDLTPKNQVRFQASWPRDHASIDRSLTKNSRARY